MAVESEFFPGGQFIIKKWKTLHRSTVLLSTPGQYGKSMLWQKRWLSALICMELIQPWMFEQVYLFSKVRKGTVFQENHNNQNSSWKLQTSAEDLVDCDDWWPPLSYNQWEGWCRVTRSLGTWTRGGSTGKDDVWQLTNHTVVFLWHRTWPGGTAC